MKFTIYLFAFMMCLAFNQVNAETYDYPKRELRRGSSGGRDNTSGRYSYSNSTTTTYRSSYKPASTTVSNYNKYFDAKAGRTYEPLTTYYLPPNYYSSTGFYSPQYGMVYYNGYGYNFYTGNYGYYQNSPNAAQEYTGSKASGLHVMMTIVICSIGVMSIY